jgi:hypothetical protein
MRSRPELSLFLANEEIGTWLKPLPDGWRIETRADGRWTHVDVTRDPLTAEPRCSCSARGRPCKHVRALAAVGLLPAAVPV